MSGPGRSSSRGYELASNPLGVESEATAGVSPLVAARLKAGNTLHMLGLGLLFAILCALPLRHSPRRVARANVRGWAGWRSWC